ncbi:hypothetical protein [Verrucosispora sp. WMMD573]|uniref:hypothetical protein n=1 Tax=Verrucosispora sp. WMMD573 TaxID=3015149 RepID=UPI00248CB6AD|nr:hypothetical protein [Verrucosispora sp. WMMD573]WBB53827.1 hypothetical protein O7601_25225 [Verrucosispora sp. WMMD573]
MDHKPPDGRVSDQQDPTAGGEPTPVPDRRRQPNLTRPSHPERSVRIGGHEHQATTHPDIHPGTR